MLPISRSFRDDRSFGPHNRVAMAALCVLVFSASGCTSVDLPRPSGQSLLKQPRMSPDSVVLDVFVAKFPFGDPEINGSAWEAIDEQHPPVEYRRRFLANGFRAGVLAGQMPNELSKLLNVAGNHVLPGEMNQLTAEELVAGPTVLRGHVQVRSGVRKDMVVTQSQNDLPIMIHDETDGLSGKNYCRPEFLFVLRAESLNDGRVRIELTPEIHHGAYSQRWKTDNQGIFHLNPGREKRSFDDMKIEATLSAGHMLVVSSVPSRPGSLGHHFFSETSGNQKLILIRLSQTQHDGEFDRRADLVIE